MADEAPPTDRGGHRRRRLGPTASTPTRGRRRPARLRRRPQSTGAAVGGGGGGGGGFGANLAATPELLAELATLPPADDEPDVDPAAAAAEPTEPFRMLGSCGRGGSGC